MDSKASGRYLLASGLLAASVVSMPGANARECPLSPTDPVAPIVDFDPPALPGEPEMTVAGLYQFARDNAIDNVADLLSTLPERYAKGYVMVERTRTDGHASLEYPRVILFGSDARLMLNVSTDPADPGYEKVDLAYMEPRSGKWEFSQLDFAGTQVEVERNAVSCSRCHGSPARPIWGEYLLWPGVVGDNPAPGPQAETLTAAHARRMNELKAGEGNPDRFHTLQWARRYRAGESQLLPDHVYGHAMSIFNMELGFSVAQSIFRRLQTIAPARYELLREELLLLGYFGRRARLLTHSERADIAALIAAGGGAGDEADDLFAVLGVDARHELSLHKLAGEAPDTSWNVGSGDLDGLVYALVLDDLASSDPVVRDILERGPNGYGIFSCPPLGKNTFEVLDYKIFQGWTLVGAARQAAHEEFFGIDVDRIEQPVLDQVARPLYEYLRTRISDPADIPGGPVPAPAPTRCTAGVPLAFGQLESGKTVCVSSEGGNSYYYVWIPRGAERLRVQLRGGSGNADLYYNEPIWADADTYMVHARAPGNDEDIVVERPAPGWRYVTLVPNSVYADASLVVTVE